MARTLRRKLPAQFMQIVRDYAQNRTLRERALIQEEKWKKVLMSTLEEAGAPIPGGHRVIELPEPVSLGKKVMTGMKRQRAASSVLDSERTEKFLRERGLWDSCTETVTVINEDAILAKNFAKEISDVELQALYEEKERFSFIPIYEGEHE